MKDKNEQHDFDERFKDQLGDFEVPRARFTAKGSESAPEEEVDQLFQKGFKDFESTPAPQIWENIQDSLPLHLIWRRRLIRLSQVAAVFVLIAFTSVLLTQNNSPLHQWVNVEEKASPAPTLPSTPNASETDFVYDLEQHDEEQGKISKTLLQEELRAERELDRQKRDLQDYVENHGDMAPLAKSPIEELDSQDGEEALSGDNLKSNLKSSVPIRTASKEDETTKDIMAIGTPTNPAQ